MIGFVEGLFVTIRTALRRPVTAQYPDPSKRQPVADLFMGFPALTWDNDVQEPYCTGCMVCVRDCPTQCMSAIMSDNPQHAEGRSRRRKIVEAFEINLGRCILCGICVDVCPFEALFWSPEYEYSEPKIADLLHDKTKLSQWMETVPDFQEYESGSEAKKPTVPQ